MRAERIKSEEKKKVLVINPPNAPFTERSLLIEPIDTLTVATFMKELGCEVEFIDMDLEQMHASDIRDHIKTFMPDYTIIPFDYHIPLHTTETASNIATISRIAKTYGSTVIVGGKTATAYPEMFLQKKADIVIAYEMEPALKEIIADNIAMDKIQGIIYKDKTTGKMLRTPEREELIHPDDLPIPDRSLADINDYNDVRTIWTSRGCPGQCSFCPSPSFWRRWRARAPKKVVDEIEYLIREFDAKKILLLDDNATVNRKRMHKISEEIIRRDLKVKLGCLGTIADHDREMMQQMYDAGFRWIHYGVESGCDNLLKEHQKNITAEQIKKAIYETKRLGFRVRTSWILDLPGTTPETMQKTIDLIMATQSHEIRLHFLALRAGTKLFQQSEKDIQPQYIHSSAPQLKGNEYIDRTLIYDTQYLTMELKKKGYGIINDPKEFRNLKRLHKKTEEMKLVTLCPLRYGLAW